MGAGSARPCALATALAALALAGSAGAQEAGVESTTGSHLRLKDPGVASPVVVFDREQIRQSGIVSIGDFLQQMPEQGGALNTSVNNGGDGETAISLRNLGAQRTLVLVDGKRWVNGGSGPGSFVDLNSIPSALIERVEVLKDGASAVYGADAVAGVVNIITRRRMNGVELEGYGGMSPRGDAQQYDVRVTGGVASEKGSFLLGGGYFDQKALFAGSRDWASSALTYNFDPSAPVQVTKVGSPTVPSGRAQVNLNNCNGNALCDQLNAAYHTALNCPATGGCFKTFIFDETSPACAGGFVATPTTDFTKCQIGNWRPMVGFFNPQNGPTNDLYNFQAVNYLITPSRRIQLFSNGDYSLASSARAYFQGSFVNRQSETLLSPEPLSTSEFGARLNTDNVYNPFGNASDPACAGNSTAAGCGQSVSAARRLVEAGGRSTRYDLDTFRAVAGFDGTLPEDLGPLRGVFWDVSFNYGRTWGTTTYNGSVNTGLTAQALGSTHVDFSGTPSCGTASLPVPGCVPANLFGPAGTVTPAMLSSLGLYTGISSGWTQLVGAQANFNAPLFQLASERPIGLAGGWEYRQMYGGYTPDPIANAGNSLDFSSNPTRGGYHLNEGYLELQIPLARHLAGAEELELQAAVRAYQYSTFGSGAVYKLGGLWRPVRGLTLRGTWSTNIREPDLFELYSAHHVIAEPARDPCAFASPTSPLGQRCALWLPRQGGPVTPVVPNCDCSVMITSIAGGNPALQPEKAYVGTVGLTVEPAALPGLSASVGYHNLKLTQTIGAISAQAILQGCYFGGNDAYCALIHRDSAYGFISDIVDIQQNAGVAQTSGLDLGLRYGLTTGLGRFGFLFDSTYLIYYRQTLPSGETISAAGNYDLGGGTATGSLTPKLKFNAGLDYALAGLTAGLRARYIGGFDECANAQGTSNGGLCSLPVDANGKPVAQSPYPAHQVPAYVTFDVVVSYLYRTQTTFAVGVHNLFDASPPYVYNETFIFTDPGYDLAGRVVYARVGQVF